MPSEIDKVKLTREQDRRYKLSVSDVERIKLLHSEGITKTQLAREFGVSLSTVRYYLSDNVRERRLAAMREYNLVRPARDKERRNAYMRELRAYKKKLNMEVSK